MKLFTLFLCMVFLHLCAIGQGVVVKTIKQKDAQNKTTNNVFPYVEIAANRLAADKINRELQTDFLMVNWPSKVKQGIFESDDFSGSFSDISFEVKANNGRLLSLAISGDACGAYCEYYTNYYNFDARTGEKLLLGQLFLPEFKSVLLDTLNRGKRALIAGMISRLNDTLRDTKRWNNSDDSTLYSDMLDLHTECAARDPYTSYEYMRYYLSRDTFFVELERCSAHYNRGIDELYTFQFSMPISRWERYFNEYVRNLLK